MRNRSKVILVTVLSLVFGATILSVFWWAMKGQLFTPMFYQKEKDIVLARQALLAYFDLLSAKEYNQASLYHGSGYEILQMWNPAIDPLAYEALLKEGCESNGWLCLKIKNIVAEEQISLSEFKFVVQFEKPNSWGGEDVVFAQGACCGEEDTGERKTDFEYFVVRESVNFVVKTPPLYMP